MTVLVLLFAPLLVAYLLRLVSRAPLLVVSKKGVTTCGWLTETA
jgi:hypothetical protein